jgi:hypothetical protein
MDTVIGLCLAISFAAAAYFDHAEESKVGVAEAGFSNQRSPLARGLSTLVLAVISAIVLGFSVYLFAEVPALLWEITAALVLGSLTLRLFFHFA